MDQKPKIPTLKDSQKPQVRIKGLAARLSLVERLKQFKKKDLAFILAGLGVLFMAPLAEHFMMSPENADSGSFKPGWGFQAPGFGGAGSPYETGVNGMAPGGQIGGGGDVITPLNVRDPSALIMGPGASQQPAATSTTPPAPAKENTDWKDAIANAASKGASAATKAASLPVPKSALTNAGLRGLGVASGGGGGAQWNAPPINASHAPNSATPSNSLQTVGKAPGYMGVGSRGNQNGSASSAEDLKRRAGLAGSDFNRQGSAGSSAETAAGRGMGSGDGSGGVGEGGAGKDDKGGSGNSGKDSKALGDSLAFLAAKMNQEKAIDLAWKLKEKEAMLWPDLKQKILETTVMDGIVKPLTTSVAKMVTDFGGDADEGYYLKCDGHSDITIPQSCADPKAVGRCCDPVTPKSKTFTCQENKQITGSQVFTCTKTKGPTNPADPKTEVVPPGGNAVDYGSANGTSLDDVCGKKWLSGTETAAASANAAAQKLSSVNLTLGGTNGSKCKGTTLMDATQQNIPTLTADAKTQLDLVKGYMTAAAKALGAAGPDSRKNLVDAKTIDDVNKLLDEAALPATAAEKAAQDCKKAKDLAALKPEADDAHNYVKFQDTQDVKTAQDQIKDENVKSPLDRAQADLAAIKTGLGRVDDALQQADGGLTDLLGKPGAAGQISAANMQPQQMAEATKLTQDLRAIQTQQLTAASTARDKFNTLQTGYDNATTLLKDPGTLTKLAKDTNYVVNGDASAQSTQMNFPKLQDTVSKMDLPVVAADVPSKGKNITQAKTDYGTTDTALKAALQTLVDPQSQVSTSVDNMYGDTAKPAPKK